MPHEMGAEATRERKSDTGTPSLERSNNYGRLGQEHATHWGVSEGNVMRVLVVGAGRMGAIRVEDLVADPRVTDVLITNRNNSRALDLSATWGATVVPWDQATTTEADAVVVAVGTDAHDHILSGVLPHGRPVLCEKPIALTLEDTAKAIALAASSGAPLQIGFQRRFDASIRAVHDSIHSGGLGTLYSMTMASRDHTPSQREFIAGSGGIFRDLHVHDFDLVRWLTGSEVESVSATKQVREHQDYADFDDADISTILLTTTSGVQVTIAGARHDAVGHDVRLEVYGSKDSVSAGLNVRTPLRTMEGDLALNTRPYTGFVDRFREAFKAETTAFVTFALGEGENPAPPESALESLRVAIACEESIAQSRAIAVADIT
jgi:myo-inositol 2-dehydrogenase / D-chiro-inositol 1-dehydrogenase